MGRAGRAALRAGGAAFALLAALWLLVPVVPFEDPLSTVVLDRDGELLGATIASDGQWRFGVARAVPPKFEQAITCFEDRRFRLHPGVDPLALARAGRNVFGVHLDRRATLPNVERIQSEIAAAGGKSTFFNINAADPEKMEDSLEQMVALLGKGGDLGVLMHSLAFGTLRPYLGEGAVSSSQMDMTLRVMAHSLVDWTQSVMRRSMMGPGGRVFAMTSSGSTRIIPSYGPVSAAKAALESLVRTLAQELGSRGIRVNAVSPERTDTPMRRVAFPDEDRTGMLGAGDVAGATLRLLRSDLTGQVVDVKRHDVAGGPG